MSPFLFRIPVLLAIAFLACTAHIKVSAAPLTQNEEEQVRAIIVAQFQAFQDDDADKAFETAAPGVREAIGSSGRFLALVRGVYPMVYRPSAVAFLKPEKEEGQVLQLVQITDGNDKSWLALFALEKQTDESWRISGCVVAENSWTPV